MLVFIIQHFVCFVKRANGGGGRKSRFFPRKTESPAGGLKQAGDCIFPAPAYIKGKRNKRLRFLVGNENICDHISKAVVRANALAGDMA